MRRRIVGFEIDDAGDPVALLACGHRQHVRHDPPWRTRAWAASEQGRRGAIGRELECPPCDADEAKGAEDPPCGTASA